jgi:hypothetical protein
MSAYNPPDKKTTIYNSVNYGNAITALADTTFDEVSASIGKFTQLFLGSDNVATILNGKQDDLANQVGFRAFSESSSFTTLGGKLPYNIADYNFESAYNGINHEFTAPLNGRYFFSFSFFPTSACEVDLIIEPLNPDPLLNTTTFIREKVKTGATTEANEKTGSSSTILLCEAGDKVYVQLVSGSIRMTDTSYSDNYAEDGNQHSSFVGQFLG